MNDFQQDQKIQADVNRVKKDLNALKNDGINKVNTSSADFAQSTDGLVSWVNSGVGQLSDEFVKVKNDATETVVQATTTAKKKVGSGLTHYNAKVTELAEQLPGDVGTMAGKYPWVAISFALIAGFLLRGIFMRRSVNLA